MKIVYVEGGPDIIRMGGIQFTRGEPKDVPEEEALRILAKMNVKFVEDKGERKKEKGKNL